MLAPIRFPARVLAALVAGVALAVAAVGGPAAADAARAPASVSARVLIVFLPVQEPDPTAPPGTAAPVPASGTDTILPRLDAIPQLALGLTSAAQGTYDPVQALLDMTQGTRVSLATYHPRHPDPMVFVTDGPGEGSFVGWAATAKRAADAPAELQPGLLASLVPGGAGYAGVAGRDQREAIVAADRAGRVAEASIGPEGDVADRATGLLRTRRLVVAGLPVGAAGERAVAQLVRTRAPGELLIVMQAPPSVTRAQLLPTGVAGLAGGAGTLTSDTTHLRGVVAGIDILPTTAARLGLTVPSTVKGQPITAEPGRDAAGLQRLVDRLRVVLPRRLPTLWMFLGTWLGMLLAAVLVAGPRGRRWAMRAGALGVLWIPTVVLVTGQLRPARLVELLLITGLSLILGALTDRLVAYPRGPAVPALVALVLYAIDLAAGSPMLIRSLLGPNPLYGSRFYGIGNELEAALSALLLIGVAGLLVGRARSRAGVAAFAAGGVVFALILGSGRLGADVGGVITVAAGAAIAAVLMLPGGVTKRALAITVLAPVLGLAALAVLDLATGGNSHFTRTVLRADGSGALWDLVARRYELAGRQAVRGFMPAATVIALLAVAVGIKERATVLEGARGDAAWRAALGGIVAVGVAGALFNDSGPVLLLFAVFIAGCVVAYLRGAAALAPAAGEARDGALTEPRTALSGR